MSLTTAFTEKYKWTGPYGMEFPCLISIVGQPSSGKTHFTLFSFSIYNFSQIY